MSFSIVVRVKVGKGVQKEIKNRSKHTLQYVLCVLYDLFFSFFLQGAVLAALFVHCKVRGSHVSLSCTHSDTLHLHHIQDKLPTPNTSTLVLTDTVHCSWYTMCVYLTSHLITSKSEHFNIRQNRFQISCPH